MNIIELKCNEVSDVSGGGWLATGLGLVVSGFALPLTELVIKKRPLTLDNVWVSIP